MSSNSLEHRALSVTDDFPIRTDGPIHSGKVRSVYWLPQEACWRLIREKGYDVPLNTPLGVMITSDRISAFDVNWQGENGLTGVPGKGAALNAMSDHFFSLIKKEGVSDHHVLDSPHPLVWIVRRAKQVKVESIARAYITGSMWAKYEAGTREFCGERLPEGLVQYQKLDELLLTPTTKGTLRINGIPEKEDAPISRQQILDNKYEFGFINAEGVHRLLQLTRYVHKVASQDLYSKGIRLIDFKLEGGYVKDKDGRDVLILTDEPVTADSARMINNEDFEAKRFIERSKETFRQYLLNYCDQHVKPHGRKILREDALIPERKQLAETYRVPEDVMMTVSGIYSDLAKQITGKAVPEVENPRKEIMSVLKSYGLLIPGK